MSKKVDLLFGDLLWGASLALWVAMLAVPVSRGIFLEVTELHPYLGGFVKFLFLASMGDLLGYRILNRDWKLPRRFILKAVVWGLIGMAITLFFSVFVAGTSAAQAAGKLPFENSRLALAFFSSLLMNTTFGPMLYIYHKFGDYIVDYDQSTKECSMGDAFVEAVDWNTMVNFYWIITCGVIWIPLHTLVFLMPVEYRVLASAFLSILLGILVALSKRSKSHIAKDNS